MAELKRFLVTIERAIADEREYTVDAETAEEAVEKATEKAMNDFWDMDGEPDYEATNVEEPPR